MRRGFKSQAERLAADIRGQHVGSANQAVPLDAIASDLGIKVVAADELVPRERIEALNELQPDAFSAATFRRSDGDVVVVYNPLHSQGRIRSDQAHELAHILLDHDVQTVERFGGLKFLTCDLEQEEEADWLAGCLLLPRDVLYAAARRGMNAGEIAERYGTSEPMARFRLNASGVLVQIGRARASRGS